jgi:hypothetical protein
MNMRSWQRRKLKHIIHVAGRVLAEDACTPIMLLEIIPSVLFAILTELA